MQQKDSTPPRMLPRLLFPGMHFPNTLLDPGSHSETRHPTGAFNLMSIFATLAPALHLVTHLA